MDLSEKRVKVVGMVKIKDEGNDFFGKGDYGRAIAYYKQGLRMIEEYYTQNEGMLPMRREIGENEKLGENIMFLQDFQRLKATFMNNLSSCLFN